MCFFFFYVVFCFFMILVLMFLLLVVFYLLFLCWLMLLILDFVSGDVLCVEFEFINSLSIIGLFCILIWVCLFIFNNNWFLFIN